MKIALIGYGKMGKTIEKIARARGHEIVSVIDADNQQDFDSEAFRSADAAIEFTMPTAAFANCCKALQNGVAVISGSTGWTDRLSEVKALCQEKGGAMLYSSNFSIGVNLFFAVNKYLAKLMNGFNQYDVDMTEIHHIHKLDHPSGTAITLAEEVLDNIDRKKSWTEDFNATPDKLRITSEREGEVPGTHIIRYTSPVDKITIEHEAFTREGFALGAVVAAEWINGRTGWFTMDDMLNLNNV